MSQAGLEPQGIARAQADAHVTGEIVGQGRAEKILVFHYKRKKQYKKIYGHRQPFTAVRITEIAFDGERFTAPELPARKPKKVKPAAAEGETAPAKSAETKLAAGQAKSGATKPAEKPARAQDGSGEEVLQTVLAWAGAWSKQNVETYLAFYAQDFKTPKGEARSEWEAVRRQRISSPKKIEVAIESPKVTLRDQNNAVVSFRQMYRSDNLNIRSRKTLFMVRNEGRWLIQQERAGG